MFFFFFFRLRPLIYFRCLVETCEEFGYFVNMQFYDIEVMFKGSVTHCCYAMYGGATLSSIKSSVYRNNLFAETEYIYSGYFNKLLADSSWFMLF